MEVLQYIEKIGSILGMPVALWLAWQAWRLTSVEKKVNNLESESKSLRNILSDMKETLGYIKGKVENLK